MRVSLFVTCLGDQFFADAAADAVRLLRHLGVSVDFPEAQTCCGQPAHNSGHRRDAERMVRHTCRVFDSAEYVVAPSGSCASMLRTHYPELAPDVGGGIAERTYELGQFIVDVLGVTKLGNGLAGRRVGVHHGCHALRELGVEAQPEALLRGAGAEVVSWAAAKECCGFGGLFSTKMPEVSAAMADHKLETLPDVDVVTSADGGCLMQLSGRADRRGSSPPFIHLATMLWEGARG
ncbi:MAG: (Fe-S)-binding protein [Gemmatimonadota bacterium]